MTYPIREYYTSKRHQEERETPSHNILMMSRRDIVYETHVAPRFKNKWTITGRRTETDILKEIRKIKDTFGPIKDRDSRSVPFTRLIRLFDAVIKHIRGSEYEEMARRILIITEKIEKMIGTLLIKTEINNIGNINYA